MEDAESGDESIGHESVGPDEDEPLVPKHITDDYFDELTNKSNATIKNLQAEQQYTLADDFQQLLGVCQSLRKLVTDEKSRNSEMRIEVTAAIGKVAAAVKISQNDQETIQRLKLEIESAWKEKDAAQNREQAIQEQMYAMREKLEKIQIEVDKAEKKDINEELGMTLASHKDGILRERDRLNAEVEELNRRLQIQRLYTDEMEKKRTESENQNKNLCKLLDDTSSEAFKEKRLLDALKKELSEVTAEKNSTNDKAEFYKNQSETWHNKMSQQNIQILNVKSNLERVSAQHSSATAKLAKYTTDLDAMTQFRDRLQIELNQKSALLKLKDSESNKLYKENGQLSKNREVLQKKLMYIESIKSDLSQEIFKLKNTIFTYNKERDANKKAFDRAKKFSENVIRERDLVRKDLQKANRVIGEQAEVILLHEQHLKTLENEIKGHLAAALKQKSILGKVEKERDRNAEESQILADRVEQIQEELHIKINEINELKENLDEFKIKLAQVQQLFETARSERNSFQRDLQSTIEDRDDTIERLKITSRQKEQLKEDVAVKENELSKANKNIDKLEKDKVTLKLEIHNTNVILQNTRTELKEKKIENERLYKTLSDDEITLLKLRKQLENAQNEKDLIGTQMIRRNDEIGLLREKINIIQMALDRGETQYNKRLDDIRLLKIEIGNIRSQRNLLTRGLANTADMRQEVLQLHRCLAQERVKSKALEQEMMTPMNIHRWRRLTGKDPEKMDLLTKTQTLQRRILGQSVTVAQKEQSLDEAHKLYLSLKEFMSKLPDYSVKEQLNNTQRALNVKTKKLKALTAEVNATEIDIHAKDCILDNLQKSLLETKQELVKEKKEKQKLKDELDSTQIMYPVQNVSGPKTLGAGFKIPNIINYE